MLCFLYIAYKKQSMFFNTLTVIEKKDIINKNEEKQYLYYKRRD